VLDTLPRAEGSPWVFPSWRGGGHLVDVRAAIRRAAERWAEHSSGDMQGEWFTPHDLRRTVLTNLAEQRIPLDVRKAVANHKGRADVSAIYDRHDRAREKRQALDAWARRLDGILAGRDLQAQVVELIRS
jgi:integrase